MQNVLHGMHEPYLILGIYFAAKILQDPSILETIGTEWASLGNIILCNKSADEIEEHDKEVAIKIKKFYYGDDTSIIKGSLSTLIQMFGDAYVFGPDEYFCSLIMDQSAQPLYMYSFDYQGSWRFGDFVTSPFAKKLQQIFLSFFGIKVSHYI